MAEVVQSGRSEATSSPQPVAVAARVTVVIPVYNRPVLVERALDSVVRQDHRDIEILVVDDGSTDSTPEVLRQLAQKHSNLRVLRQANAGVGSARQNGLIEATGEFVQFLDSDDRILPGKLSAEAAYLETRPDCDAVHGTTRLVDLGGKIIEPSLKGTGRAKQLLPRLLHERWWSTHTPLYRTAKCRAAGGWKSLPHYEDWEFEARLAELGCRIGFLPGCRSETTVHTGTRLAGRGRPGELGARSELQRALYRCSLAQSISPGNPDMEIFSRWLFRTARDWAVRGMASEAREFFLLAARAAGRPRGAILAAGLLATLCGIRTGGRIAERLARAGAHFAGNTTKDSPCQPIER